MIKNKIKYLNMYARFKDAHTLDCSNAKGEIKTVTADKIIIATGGRPSYPGIPGDKEFGITSDDVFSLEKAPGKTLVVGASYVALECAGFLTAFGYDTTVMVRSIFLRGFDQDMANRIGKYMEHTHPKIIKGATPSKLEKLDGPDGQITVSFKHGDIERTEKYDTVLFAMGRYALTGDICLEKAGVTYEKNGKFKVTDEEQTNVPNIYAIGDVIYGQLELTPVAIKAGILLSKRLFEGGTQKMDYVNVPTTIFTPLEYGTCGLTEEEAKA
jgi:thioredoxin reductase (NADPH)